MWSCIRATKEMPTNMIAVTLKNAVIVIMLSFLFLNVILMLYATHYVAVCFVLRCKGRHFWLVCVNNIPFFVTSRAVC